MLDRYTIEIKQDAPKVPIEAFAHGNAILSSKEFLEEHNGDLREVECCAPGTGPFMHAGGVRNDERWVQERWDGYWRPGAPHPDFLEHIWLIYQTPENDAAVKSGIVDWAAWVTPGLNEEIASGQGPKGLIGHGWIFPVVGAYIFNTNHDLFSDKRVRKAFALVIDQNDIFVALADVEAHQPGGFLPVNTAHAKPLSELMTIPGVRPTTDEDVAEAQRLMAEAGYPNGEGFPEVELLSRDSPSERIPNEAIQAMLKSRLNVGKHDQAAGQRDARRGVECRPVGLCDAWPVQHWSRRSGRDSRGGIPMRRGREMIEGVTRSGAVGAMRRYSHSSQIWR